jgi:uncharacterized membrane protein YfcA
MVIFSTITLLDMALVAASFILGGMVKGALGFGLPLTTMALLPFFVPIDAALAVNVVVLFLTNIAQFLQMGQMRETAQRFAPVLWGIVIGVPLGALMITSFSDALLMLALGAVVVVFSGLSLGKVNLQIAPMRERSAGWAAGILGGAVGAMTTVGGPLFVMYLLGLQTERREFLSALSLFFILSAALISGAFVLVGVFTLERLVLSGVALPAAIAGMWLGNRMVAQVPAQKFRALVLAVLGCLGLNLIWRGVMGG